MTGLKKRWVQNYLLVVLVVVVLGEGIFLVSLKQYYYSRLEQLLLTRVTISAEFINEYMVFDWGYPNSLEQIVRDYTFKEESELQIINHRGQILVSASGFIREGKLETGDYLAALSGETGIWVGTNTDTGERVMAVSAPMEMVVPGGVLRLVTSLEPVDKALTQAGLISLVVCVLVLVVMALLSGLFTRSVINPLHEINVVAQQMAQGDFSVRTGRHYDDEIGELAETLNYMAEEIQAVEKLKNDFIASISHELRTPLTAIRGWSETLIIGELEDKEELVQGLKVIIKETGRLSRMVEELLDFSRLEGGHLTIRRETVQLLDELEELLQIFAARAQKEGIRLVYHHPETLPVIWGDRYRLRQVLINLLDNAIKFTPAGGEIIVAVGAEGRQVLVTIRDEGLGISAEELPRVKEKFFKGRSQKAGSGIGLAIADEIIKLHGGELVIESKLGHGTRVSMSFKPKSMQA